MELFSKRFIVESIRAQHAVSALDHAYDNLNFNAYSNNYTAHSHQSSLYMY